MRKQREAAIAGVHQTKQGDLSDRGQAEVWFEVAKAACDDAGISLGDIDGLIMGGPDGAGIRNLLPGAALGYDLLGKPLRFHASSSVGASATAAGINLAVYAVSAGLADAVLIDNTVAGRADGRASANRDEAIASMAKLSGPYEYIYGTTRVSDYAVLARRHMHEYGTTSEQLAEVAVAQRYGSTLHPLSFQGHRGELTIDDVLGSRMIADPLRMLDCCAVNQGAGAIVVTTAEAVRANGRHRPIGLLGYGEGHSHIDPNAAPSLAFFEAAQLAADNAFDQSGVSRDDIDVAGIGDHFTINVLFGLEAAGFCKPGEGGTFVEEGALKIDGRSAHQHRGRLPVLQPRRRLRHLHVDRSRRAASRDRGWTTGHRRQPRLPQRFRRRHAEQLLGHSRRGLTTMSANAKFVPEGVPAWQQPFWDSLRERDVKVQQCDSCGTFRHVPKEICTNCFSTDFSWTPISGVGVVYTYSIVHRAPTPAYQEDAPYAIVHVTMAEGFRMIGTMTGVDPEAVVHRRSGARRLHRPHPGVDHLGVRAGLASRRLD